MSDYCFSSCWLAWLPSLCLIDKNVKDKIIKVPRFATSTILRQALLSRACFQAQTLSPLSLTPPGSSWCGEPQAPSSKLDLPGFRDPLVCLGVGPRQLN